MPKHAATSGKHRAGTELANKVPAPVAVKAGAKGASMVQGRHRAETATPTRTAEYTRFRDRRTTTQDRPTTQYRGKNSLYTPRSSRTRYIRYIGQDEASNVGKLFIEWLVGVVLISITIPLQGSVNGYQKTVTAIMYRLTALTAVFFVLAIMSGGKGSKVAVYGGLLVDLGIAFNAVRKGTIGELNAVFTGTKTNSGVQPAADISDASSAVPMSSGLFNPSIEGAGYSTGLSGGGSPTGGGNAPIPA